MKNKIFFVLAAIVMLLGSCNSAEKEQKALEQALASTSTADAKAYLSQYADKAPEDHLKSARTHLNILIQDSMAYESILKAKDVELRVKLEKDYLTKFEDCPHVEQVTQLLKKDSQTLKLKQQEEKEAMAKKEEEAAQEQEDEYSYYADDMVSYVFHCNDDSKAGDAIILDKPLKNGKGCGVWVNPRIPDSHALAFQYQISPRGDLNCTIFKNGRHFIISITTWGLFTTDLYYDSVDFTKSYEPETYQKYVKKIFIEIRKYVK